MQNSSHEYANKLGALADFLMSKPEFSFDSGGEPLLFEHFYDKQLFLAAAKAIGSGSKEWTDTELVFKPKDHPELRMYINRTKVCRKVQEEKWECEPILSEDEQAKIGA